MKKHSSLFSLLVSSSQSTEARIVGHRRPESLMMPLPAERVTPFSADPFLTLRMAPPGKGKTVVWNPPDTPAPTGGEQPSSSTQWWQLADLHFTREQWAEARWAQHQAMKAVLAEQPAQA